MLNQESARQSRRKTVRNICIIAAVLGAYFYLLQGKPSLDRPRFSMVETGLPAPDFALPRMDGQVVRLSDYRGKVVLLNIWATWCGSCRAEMPSMEKLYQALKDDAFEMLVVSIDSQGARAIAPFVERYQLTFPILLDEEGRIGRLYRTTGIPETFIIDKTGNVISKTIGSRDWSDPKTIEILKALVQAP